MRKYMGDLLMPYKIEGNKILHKVNNRWRVKQVASSPEKAMATVRLLQGVEHGWRPTGLAAADAATRRRVASMGGRARRR